ncbi:hypothetical protein WR25_21687 [Diploscapter pachys]|uniref:Major facilitator superfamily (MFS) profile domain-containing protein n=1 Tax=Diploscapter pachys TaxID=2018661 RepID=A0A2A2LBT4_9BILA|nr:hypothetical protein WR25_21687 [Diploscapter pachys]
MTTTAGGRRASVRTRLKAEDVSTWVASNPKATNLVAPVALPSPHVTFKDIDIESTLSSDSSLSEQPKYEDGGYGWVIVFYSFVLHFILDGASLAFGVVFPQILEKFNVQRTGGSIVAALFLAQPLLVAPIVGKITDIFDCKFTAIFGGVLCFICVILSKWCDSFPSFTLIYGGGMGLGMAFLYNAAICIVTYYFNEKRGIATALAVSGTGFGTVLFPHFLTGMPKILIWARDPLSMVFPQTIVNAIVSPPILDNQTMEYIPDPIHSLDYTLTTMTLAVLVMIMVSVLIEDVEWTSDTNEYKERKFNKTIRKLQQEDVESLRLGDPLFDECFEPRRAISLPSIPSFFNVVRNLERAGSIQSVKEALIEQPARSRSIGTFMRQHRPLPTLPEYTMLGQPEHWEHLEHLDLQMANSPNSTVHAKPKRVRVVSKTSMSLDCLQDIEEATRNMEVSDEEESSDESSSCTEMSNDGDSSSSELSDKILIEPEKKVKISDAPPSIARTTSRPPPYMPLSNGFPVTSRNMRTSLAAGFGTSGRVMASNTIGMRLRTSTNLLSHQGRMLSAPNLAPRRKRRSLMAKLHLKGLMRSLKEDVQTYWRLLQMRSQRLYVLSVFCLYLVVDVIYVYFVDHATETLHLQPSESASLISAIGLSTIIFTYVFGFLSDVERINKKIFFLNGASMFVLGVAFLACPWVHSYVAFVGICVAMGASVSSNYVLQSILSSWLLSDMSEFQAAYSLVSFAAGIASFFGPLVIGFIRDETGSYSIIFLVSGIVSFISGVLSFYVQIIEDREEEEEENKRKRRNSAEMIKPVGAVEIPSITNGDATTPLV